ncbi:MAG: pentapeptide repeat-containing protein [Acidobacteria bacterium]|nr:pentapeptide repeat-containing protein [Acidobacteriota bacterium]
MITHLRPDEVSTFWQDIDLDLSGAYLHRLEFTNCQLRFADFSDAQFAGHGVFGGTKFTGPVWFSRAHFPGGADFIRTRFGGGVGFGWTRFDDHAEFSTTEFTDLVVFAGARFSGEVAFRRTRFNNEVKFDMAEFSGGTAFDTATFSREVTLGGARARPADDHDYSWPAGWTTRDASDREEEGWVYLTRIDDSVDR